MTSGLFGDGQFSVDYTCSGVDSEQIAAGGQVAE
ncbi:hypothetical protein DES35_1133, partial [Schleiferia thermophila]